MSIYQDYLSKVLEEALIVLGKKAYPNFGTVAIMAGGAGSGKGFTIGKLLGLDGKILDVDALKMLATRTPAIIAKVKKETGRNIEGMDFKNPDNVAFLHVTLEGMGLTKGKETNLFTSILSSDKSRKPNLIFDVTMKETSKFASICDQVQALGYEKQNIHLVWVINELETAMAQNKTRDRVVPEAILKSTHVGAASSMYDLISDSSKLTSHMDGDVVLAFNKAKVDATVISNGVPKIEGNGSYVSRSNYIHIKRKGRAPNSLAEISEDLLKKIRDYTGNDKFSSKNTRS